MMWLIQTPPDVGPVNGVLYGTSFHGGITLVSTYHKAEFLVRRGFIDVTDSLAPKLREVIVPPKKILIARHGGIGDMLMITPLIEGLKKKFPDVDIQVSCVGVHTPVLFGNPHISGFRDDILITDGALAGDEADDFYELSHSIEFNPAAELENGATLTAQRYGVSLDSYTPRYYPIVGEREGAGKHLFNTLKLPRSLPIIAFQLDASSPFRTLPTHHALTLLGALARRKASLLVFGNQAITYRDAQTFKCKRCRMTGWVQFPSNIQSVQVTCGDPRCKTVFEVARVPRPKNIYYVGTQYPLRTVAAMLSYCEMLVCVDSGLMHLAAAQEVPVFLMGSAFDAYLTAGAFKNTHIHQQPYPCAPCHLHAAACYRMKVEGAVGFAPCMNAIPIPEVLTRINALLDEPEKSRTDAPVYNHRCQIPTVDTFRACPFCGTRNTRSVARKGSYIYLRCSTCKAVYTHKAIVDLTPYTESEIPITEYSTEALKVGEAWLGRWLAKTAPKLVTSPHRRALDIGCGYGSILDGLRQQGWQTHGVELNPIAAKAGLQHQHAVVQGDVTQYQLDVAPGEGTPLLRVQDGRVTFLPGVCDLIVLSHVFEHFGDQFRIAALLKNILAPGGAIYISGPCLDGKLDNTIIFNPIINRTFAGEHQAVPSQLGMQHLFARVGLSSAGWFPNQGEGSFESWWVHAK